jgi:ComF family protein
VSRWLTLILDLIYPPLCCHCAAPSDPSGLCSSCIERIALPRPPHCQICGVPFRTRNDADHACGPCITDPPAFGVARAAAIYDASQPADQPLKAILQRYKYSREVALAAPLAQFLRRQCPFDVRNYDVIVPVPLHLSRLRWRGFNQAALLARRIAAGKSVPVDVFALERTRATQPQVELDEKARRQNVAAAFRVSHPDRIRRRRVLLVDDVYTTGSTVNECSRVLRGAGARAVDVLVLARAVLS